MTAHDNLLAARFTALAPDPLPANWQDILGRVRPARREAASRRRRLAIVFAVAVVVAAAAAAAYGTVRVLFLDEGFIGLPSIGARPSAPESGELVIQNWIDTDGPKGTAVWEYRIRAIRICTAAHVLLDKRAEASGVTAVVEAKYWQLARRVMAETLPKLRSVSPPRAVRAKYRYLYGLMQSFAEAREALFTSTGPFWIHEVERGWGLSHCTFDLPR
jgi:hypothetical protein